MRVLHRIADTILQNLPQVMQRFEEVTEEEPWVHLPADYRTVRLADVLENATRLALVTPRDHELCRDLLHRAAEHGQLRLEQGFPDALLFQELYVVRESLWTYLKEVESNWSKAWAAEAILRIDMALSLAAKAAIRGYHRNAFEKRGDWPEVIDKLTGEWTPPPDADELEAALLAE